MTKSLLFAAFLAGSSFGQTRFDNGLVVQFPNAAANVHTESTLANSLLSTKGVVALGEGDVSHRIVLGRGGKVLFAYDISLSPVPNNSTAFKVQVSPPDPDHFQPQYVTFAAGDVLRINGVTTSEFNGVHTVRSNGTITVPALGEIQVSGLSADRLTAELRNRALARGPDPRLKVTIVSARRVYPTIAAAREFPVVRLGEAVALDILFNPTTGEKIYDVIEPVALPAQKQRVAPEDELSFERVRISVNGAVVKEPSNNWMIGTAMKVALAQYGTLYLVAKPSTNYAFEPAGRVEGNRLTFPLGSDMVEILSASNILKTRESGTVWVLREPGAKPSKAVNVEVGTAEDVLPKK